MTNQIHVGISAPKELLDTFDYLLARQGYINRSEKIRALMQEEMAKETNQERSNYGLTALLPKHQIFEFLSLFPTESVDAQSLTRLHGVFYLLTLVTRLYPNDWEQIKTNAKSLTQTIAFFTPPV